METTFFAFSSLILFGLITVGLGYMLQKFLQLSREPSRVKGKNRTVYSHHYGNFVRAYQNSPR